MDKYEYKVYTGWLMEHQLNDWGSAGWELCGIYQREETGDTFYFKRKLPVENNFYHHDTEYPTK